MSGRNCVVCNELITKQNDSKEHVITEAIGGRLKVKGFICDPCNKSAGRTWDAKLASQLHPLSLMFGVARQRGSTPSLPITTTAGEELTIMPEGGFTPTNPLFSEETTPGGVKIQIVARSMKEAKSILTGVKRKYPNTNVDQMLADAQVSDEYPKGMVHHRLEFGGEVSGRSIVKSVLAMAHCAGVSTNICGDALNYLRNPAAVPCFGYYYATDLIIDRPDEMPLHCVGIDANPDTGFVLGYAEYFGIHRVVVCLGRNYVGDHMRANYAIDPQTGEQLDLSIRIDFSEAEIEDIYNYKMIPDGAMQEAFAKVIPGFMKKQFEAEKERVIKAAVAYAFANCGAKPGEKLTEEQTRRLSRLVAERLTPFLLHNLVRQNDAQPPWVNQSQTNGEP